MRVSDLCAIIITGIAIEVVVSLPLSIMTKVISISAFAIFFWGGYILWKKVANNIIDKWAK